MFNKLPDNVPDDCNCWYSNCDRCGKKYHDSEGGCGCLDDHTECRSCDEWTHDEDLDDHNECKDCIDDRACADCDSAGARQPESLTLEDDGWWYCQPCINIRNLTIDTVS